MEQGFRSDSTVMPDRQDTRPPPEADARRDAAATALLSAPRSSAPPFSPAAEVSLAHMVVDYFGSEEIHPGLNSDIALRDRARAILAGAAPTSAGAASASAAKPDAAIIALADAASLEELTAGIRCNAAEDPPKGEDWPSFFDRSYDLLEQITATRPSTLAGIAAKARVMLTHADNADDLGSDHAVCTLAVGIARDAVRLDQAAGPRQPDDDKTDWTACPAGFIAVPANEPTAFVKLRVGIPSEARRLLDLARAEFARREASYARHSDPTVWPQVAATLRREMRMDLLELVAADLPAEQDPAEADTALRRAIGAHQAAYDIFAAACPAIDPIAVREAGGDDSEEAMAPAWETWHTTNDIAFKAWRDLFRHRPGSLVDLLALLRHVEKHIEGHIGMESEPDVFGYLVESVAALLPVAASTARRAAAADPIFAALDACRAPGAELEAFDTEHGDEKAGPGYTIERDMTVFNAAADAWDGVFATMPTTQEGRLALLGFIEGRIKRGEHRDGSPQDGEGTVFDRAYRALARIIRAERIETGFDLSKLTTLQLSNYHDAFKASAASWLYTSNAGWAEDTDGIAEAEYDRHARMRSAVAAEIKLRAPADDWDGDVRLAALIRDEMLCNGSLRHAPALRAAIAQRWGAAA